MNYKHGVAAVTEEASSISVARGNGGIVLQNLGDDTVFIGGPTVTADEEATGGFPLAGGATVTIPTIGNSARDLYVVTAADATASVAYIQPQS